MATKTKSNEIHIVRMYDAPVAMVWDAWTDPEKAAKWWGPRGFTITTHSKDLRPGGHWNYTMHGPDGTDWPNNTKYLEVEEGKKLVYDHGGNDTQPPLFRVTVLFSDVNGKTKMDMTMALDTPEKAEETKAFIKKAGGNATWDRLAEFVEKESTDSEIFVINRTFDCPLEEMYEIWTDPAKLSQWIPPTGFNMVFHRADIRVGGSTFAEMSGPNGMKMYSHADYLELQKPDRIVYTQNFADENDNMGKHPMAPTWPATSLTTVILAAEGPDKTRVTVTWKPHGNVSKEELDTFIAARGGMTQGWTGSFDKMDDYLAKH